jgi:y4mF family transcriptional regulator
MSKNKSLSEYVKEQRKRYGLTQEALAKKSGVGLRFVRDLEQGKETLRTDKVNQVLRMFGAELAPAPMDRSRFDV